MGLLIRPLGVPVEVVLIFRRAFTQVMDWKGWDAPGIVMERAAVRVEK